MKVIFINCFSISDFAYLNKFFKDNNLPGYNIIRTEIKNFNEELANDILIEKQVNVILDRSFKNINAKKLHFLKNLLEKSSLDYEVISFIKNQTDQILEQKRINVLNKGSCDDIDFLDTSSLNKPNLEYGQLFHLNEVFKSKNTIHSVDNLKSKNINIVNVLISDMHSTKINLLDIPYSKFTIISFDWYCFLFRVANLINTNRPFRKKIEENILSGKYAGEAFCFQNEDSFRKYISDAFRKRNVKIRNKFNANIVDIYKAENNLKSYHDFYNKELISYADINKVSYLSSLLLDGANFFEKNKPSVLSKAIADISFEEYKRLSFNIDFSDARLKPLADEVLKHEIIFKNRGFKSEHISQVMKCVILCRRGIDVEYSFFNLKKIVESNIEVIISTFNIRYLICIVDTYIDFGTFSERTDFLFISQFVTNMKLIETISSKIGNTHLHKRIMTDGTDPYSIVSGDAFSNMLRRFFVNSTSNTSKLILRVILEKYSETENLLTKEIFENPNIKNILKSKEFYET